MLGERAGELRERMDDPDCDPVRLHNTYVQFALVNRLVSGWERVFRRYLAPRLARGSTVLDVGCGGGDLARRLARWGERRGTPLRITAVDPDPRALAFARTRPVAGVRYLEVDAEELANDGRRFDCVISNHVLHHLPADRITGFLELSGQLSAGLALHNDLRRHAAAWLAFSLTRPFFLRSFIVEDGLRSIRRSFTPDELRDLLPSGWRVDTLAPFRNLVVREP
ncbi:MAG: methyltransferase domain-containing protein [Trueperaceae bacterium]